MSDVTPLVPCDVDLRDFPFMPLDVVRLRDSDLVAVASAEEFRCAVLLWCASWHQIPAGSLPDDDAVLSNLAGFGRAVREWLTHRPGALRGWVKCSDERFYHAVIAEKVNEAWAQKQSYAAFRDGQSQKGRKGAAKRWSSKSDGPADEQDGHGHSSGHSSGHDSGHSQADEQDQDGHGDSSGHDEGKAAAIKKRWPDDGLKGQGQGQGSSSSSLRSSEKPPFPPDEQGGDLFNDGRRDNRNPRAKGSNPRALGTSPRAVAMAAKRGSSEVSAPLQMPQVPLVLPALIDLNAWAPRWERACRQVRLDIGEWGWRSWYGGVQLKAIRTDEGERWVLQCASPFRREYISTNHSRTWQRALGEGALVAFEVDSDPPKEAAA